MRTIILALALLCVGCGAVAEEINAVVADKILQEAMVLRDAIVGRDHELAVRHMHPSVVLMMGGEEAAVKATRDGFDALKERGFEIVDYTISAPTAWYTCTEELVAFLPSRMIMNGPQKVANLGYLVASKKFGADKWVFFDGAAVRDLAGLQQMYPGLPDGIELPKKEQTLLPGSQ